jgi:hypothetical protein
MTRNNRASPTPEASVGAAMARSSYNDEAGVRSAVEFFCLERSRASGSGGSRAQRENEAFVRQDRACRLSKAP